MTFIIIIHHAVVAHSMAGFYWILTTNPSALNIFVTTRDIFFACVFQVRANKEKNKGQGESEEAPAAAS